MERKTQTDVGPLGLLVPALDMPGSDQGILQAA